MVVKPIEAIVRYSPGEWKAAVAGIVLYDGNVLLGRKTEDSTGSFTGRWHLPAEKLEIGESYEHAIYRGILEEAGIEVIVGDEIARDRTPKNRHIKWYECEALSDKIMPSEELTEVRWVPKNEVYTFLDDYVKGLWPAEVKDYFMIK